MKKERRNEERIVLGVKVCLNTEDGKVLDCDLLDVSPGGAQLRLPPGTKRRKGGETVSLQASNPQLGGLFNNKEAIVVWADGEQLGLRLLRPLALPEGELRKLLSGYLNK